MPVTRKRKIEVARLAGFGLVLAGLFALFLAVVSSQEAGAEKPAPPVNVLHCADTDDSAGGGIGDAVQYGACETTTTTGVETQGSTTTTTKPKYRCGCTTTTTVYVTPTTHKCSCSSTTTATTTSTSTTTTMVAAGETSTSTTGPRYVARGSTSTTVKSLGIASTLPSGPTPSSGGSAPVSQAEAVSGQLPFTGSSSFPLAGVGSLMVAGGLALALGRRRIAR
jgi:hypothetical protein